LWLHSLKVAQLLRSAACLHTNQFRSYLNHLVLHKITDMQLHVSIAYHHTELHLLATTAIAIKLKNIYEL